MLSESNFSRFLKVIRNRVNTTDEESLVEEKMASDQTGAQMTDLHLQHPNRETCLVGQHVPAQYSESVLPSIL